MPRRERPRTAATIDVTSLIDVLFMLLIFFMVSTTFKSDLGLDLDLPETETAGEAQAEEQLSVVVDSEGRLYYAEQQVDLGTLEERLEDALSRSERKNVVIQADREARHGQVVEVMDVIRRSGASGVTVASREK